LLWWVLAILIGLWLVGFALNVVGALIHVVLVVAAVVLVVELARRTRTA
jgi:hypothetical protein